MPSPTSVSLQVPYTENEQQFLVLAVQIAMRTFRSIHAHSGEPTIFLASSGQTDPLTPATDALPAVQDSSA
jgi:hypothetical protein